MGSFDFMNYQRFNHISKSLGDDQLVTVDLGIWFRLEKINSNYGFQRKMTSLFPEVNFCDLKVSRRGGDTYHRAILNTRNLSKLINSPNLGTFGDDYSIGINGVHINEEEEGEEGADIPDTPLKAVEENKKVEDNVLQIDLRKSSEKNGPMARGVHTYNLLSNFTEVESILTHFNIALEDVEALIKPTPAIPSLLVGLKKNLTDWVKENDVRRDPFLLYDPSPQSERMGRSQIWAHAVLEDNQYERRVTIEGIYKRVSEAEIVYNLSYNGDVLTKPQPATWKGTDLPNGDLVVNMRLKMEMNFIIIKGEAFKVSYAKQERQCSHCFSFCHKNYECEKWETDARTLMFDYYKKWQKQVGYKDFQPLKQDSEAEALLTPSQQKLTDNEVSPATIGISNKERKEDKTAKEGPDKDNYNPEILLEEFSSKYELKDTSTFDLKPPDPKVNPGKENTHGSTIRKLFEDEDVTQETDKMEEMQRDAGVREEDAGTEEGKKRKHGDSATKVSPDKKKAHTDEKPDLVKEMKKMEEEATKKDLTSVKKKVLKSRLESHINTKKDEIKRLPDSHQREHEQIEKNIRSSLQHT